MICSNLLPLTKRALILFFWESEMQPEFLRGEPSKTAVNGSARRAPGRVVVPLWLGQHRYLWLLIVHAQPNLRQWLYDLQVIQNLLCRATQGDIIQVYHTYLHWQEIEVRVDKEAKEERCQIITLLHTLCDELNVLFPQKREDGVDYRVCANG